MEFKVGDVVEWCGTIGKVTMDASIKFSNRPICVQFENTEYCLYFTTDGKVFPWLKESSLKLIKRLKRLYKVLYIEEMRDPNDCIMTDGRYSSEAEFKAKYPEDCQFVKFVEETMIEVEE